MRYVSEILKAKGSEVWSVRPDDKVYTALEVLAKHNVGAVLVRDDHQVVGILSERDYARKVILRGKASKDLPVSEIMSTRVVMVAAQRTIEESMALMTDKKIRHLPVIEEDQVIGVISIGDVVKALIAEREFEIEQLESYIRGGF